MRENSRWIKYNERSPHYLWRCSEAVVSSCVCQYSRVVDKFKYAHVLSQLLSRRYEPVPPFGRGVVSCSHVDIISDAGAAHPEKAFLRQCNYYGRRFSEQLSPPRVTPSSPQAPPRAWLIEFNSSAARTRYKGITNKHLYNIIIRIILVCISILNRCFSLYVVIRV